MSNANEQINRIFKSILGAISNLLIRERKKYHFTQKIYIYLIMSTHSLASELWMDGWRKTPPVVR